jgi:hypothetical protein
VLDCEFREPQALDRKTPKPQVLHLKSPLLHERSRKSKKRQVLRRIILEPSARCLETQTPQVLDCEFRKPQALGRKIAKPQMLHLESTLLHERGLESQKRQMKHKRRRKEPNPISTNDAEEHPKREPLEKFSMTCSMFTNALSELRPGAGLELNLQSMWHTTS